MFIIHDLRIIANIKHLFYLKPSASQNRCKNVITLCFCPLLYTVRNPNDFCIVLSCGYVIDD